MSPAQLTASNDQAKVKAVDSEVKIALAQPFTSIVTDSNSDKIEKASLTFTRDDSGQLKFSLEVKIKDQTDTQKFTGAAETNSDSSQVMKDFTLGDIGTGGFLINENSKANEECVHLVFAAKAQMPVSVLVICQSTGN